MKRLFFSFTVFLLLSILGISAALAQPANNSCATAWLLCPGGAQSGTTAGADPDGSASCFSSSKTVWFSFASNNTGGNASISITAISSSLGVDTADVVIYKGSCGALSEKSCNASIRSNATIPLSSLEPNTLFYVMVSSKIDVTFDLSITGSAVGQTVSTSTKNETCNQANGSVTITAVPGGTLWYELNGSGQSAATFNNLSAGVYNARVADLAGCFYAATSTTEVKETNGISSFDLTLTKPDCNNQGSIIVSNVSGGTAPISYYLNGGNAASTGSFTNLTAGYYIVHISDANQCDTTLYLMLANQNGIDYVLPEWKHTNCGTVNGELKVTTVTGGSGSYEYSLNGGAVQDSPEFKGLAEGYYTVKVIDKATPSCTFTFYNTYIYTLPGPDRVDYTSTNEICDRVNGTLKIDSVYGGVAPYVISYSGGNVSPADTMKNLSAGTYIILVVDSFGCKANDTLYVNELNVSATFSSQPADCNRNNGSITLSPTSGIQPFTYSSDSITYLSSPTFSSLSAGSYVYYIKDSNSCVSPIPVTVAETNQITSIETIVTEVKCNTSYGALDVSDVTGGNPPYEYSSDGINYDPSTFFNGLRTGPNDIHVRDAYGCLYMQTVIVQNDGNIQCNAGPDLKIKTGETIVLQGKGTGNIVTWDPKEFLKSTDTYTPAATPPLDITYKLLVETKEGCTCEDEVSITVNPAVSIPNTFTPNGDGINDTWHIEYIEYFPNSEVSIYSRWGERVFHQAGYGPTNEWDGRFAGGNVPAGPYYYVIELHTKDEQGEIITYSGSLSIIR